MVASWQGGGTKNNCPPPPPDKFCAVGKLSENFLLVKKISSKNEKKVALKTHILEKFGSKIEVLSTHNILCWKFAAIGKLHFRAHLFFNPRQTLLLISITMWVIPYAV